MIESYVIGSVGIALLGLVWVGIQRAWGRVFPDAFGDPDVLAERIGCGQCGCSVPCERRRPDGAASGRAEGPQSRDE